MDDYDLTSGVYRRLYSCAIHGRRINRVSIMAELVFWRAHMVADDFGVFEADPTFFCAHALTLRRSITEEQVREALSELATAELIYCYEVRGEKYALILDFTRLQPANRNGRRTKRFPQPPEASSGVLVNPGESGGIQGSPGDSGGKQVNPGAAGESGGYNNNNNNNNNNQDNHKDNNHDQGAGPRIDAVCELVNAWPSLIPGGMARIGPTQRSDVEKLIGIAGGVEGAKLAMAKVSEARGQGKKITNPVRYAIGMLEAEASEGEVIRDRAGRGGKKVYCDA